MSTFWLVLIIVGTAVYTGVGVWVFINQLILDSFLSALGWGSVGLVGSFIKAVLWPVLLPVGLILDVIDDWRGR